MSKTTAKNEIQVVLQEYLGNRKAVKVAEELYAVMQTETQHTHNGKQFFINEDSDGALMLTMKSALKEHLETILSRNLEEDEVQECLEELMAGSSSTKTKITEEVEAISVEGSDMTADIETISVEGSNSKIYSDLLKKYPANDAEKEFLENLKQAIKAGVKPFKVPVCDPSISENGSLQFVAGCKPAVGYSYNELEELASNNGVKLGSKNQYILFLSTLIYKLMKEEGVSKEDAFNVVCNDSATLGHYGNSTDAKEDFEPTGSRKVVGKCDLANTYKILAKDKEADGFWLAGGSCDDIGDDYPLADLGLSNLYGNHDLNSVGWFVL